MIKKGRWTNDERAFVKKHYKTKSPEEMARELGRTLESVKDVILNCPKEPEKAGEIRDELQSSEAWVNIKKEFSVEELKYFEEGFIKLMAQFEGNVMASEETQIFQVIKFELLMSRNLKDCKKCIDDIERMEETQRTFFAQFNGDVSKMSDSDRDFSLQMETQLLQAKASSQGKTNEYVKLQEQHNSLLRSLKSTRDQRIKQIETGKINFLNLIKALEEKQIQERESRYMKLMELAGDKEYKRLGQPTKFEDGVEDSPILCADTLDLLDQEDERNKTDA